MYINLPWKNVRMLMNIHMKNVNDVYFDTNISINMRMKVNVYIYRHKAAYCLSLSCVLLSASFMCMMM